MSLKPYNANVWVLDLAGQSWSAVSNISTYSLSAGQGFLMYVFEDCDNDGSSDLPVDLYVSGSHNQNNVTINSIPQNNYFLAGNPYILKQFPGAIYQKQIYPLWFQYGMMHQLIGKHIMVHLVI